MSSFPYFFLPPIALHAASPGRQMHSDLAGSLTSTSFTRTPIRYIASSCKLLVAALTSRWGRDDPFLGFEWLMGNSDSFRRLPGPSVR